MGKEKKKSDWDNLSEMLSQDADAPQNADDWGADEPSTAPAAEVEVETEPEAENAAKAPAKTKRVCGEKKAKATKTRKKAAPKTDKIDAALATPVADAAQDAETLDLTVAETEKAPKKRRRTTKKTEQDETELVKNVLKLEKETKAKKRARAKTAEVNPFVGLLSQIERVAQDDPTDAAPSEPVAAVEPTEAEEPTETLGTASPTTENVESENFFADFFADSNVEELEISWGRPQVDETEAQAEPEIAAEPEVAPEPVAEPEAETPVEAEVETAPRRRERRRRRRDDRAPREEADAEIAVQPTDDVKTDVDLNDLEAFFATDSDDEGVGFAPRRESKKVEKAETVEKIVLADETPVETFGADAFESDDEGDETRSKRKRRRRRGGRRSFEDDDEAPTLDGDAETESVDVPEEETVAYEPERVPRERRRRERRPRREREFDAETSEDAAETPDERRAGTPERVLPSWSDAISHVVRFNMSRRVNRRR